jgi:hypothetical protein
MIALLLVKLIIEKKSIKMYLMMKIYVQIKITVQNSE